MVPLAFLFVASGISVASAAEPDKGGAVDSGTPPSIAAFTKGLTPQRGLFGIWRKAGKVLIEMDPTNSIPISSRPPCRATASAGSG
jgi:hypothetical protein